MSPQTPTLKKTRPEFLFACSYWDAIPVTLAALQFVLQLCLLIFFPYIPWLTLILLGLFYSYCIAWNIESVAHNFTHNKYFKSHVLNRAFSLMESLSIGFSQQYYKTVHVSHHKGNSDRPDANGKTKDWYSIYRDGKNGKPESVWKYSLFGFF